MTTLLGPVVDDAYTRAPTGLYLPSSYDQPPPWPARGRPIAIDLFAGCGGFSCGFHQAGWQVIGAVEYDLPAALTYLINLGRAREYGGVGIHFDDPSRSEAFEATVTEHVMGKGGKTNEVRRPLLAGEGWLASQPEADQAYGCEHFWVADVRNLTGQQILDTLGLERGDVDAVIGGPPCQGFSLAGRRDVMDPRNSLVFEFARLVVEIQPKTMVMENVPGILRMTTPEGLPVVDALALMLSKGGMGTYDALKKSLAGTPGARAVVKGTPSSKDRPARREATETDQDDPDLLSLLDEP